MSQPEEHKSYPLSHQIEEYLDCLLVSRAIGREIQLGYSVPFELHTAIETKKKYLDGLCSAQQLQEARLFFARSSEDYIFGDGSYMHSKARIYARQERTGFLTEIVNVATKEKPEFPSGIITMVCHHIMLIGKLKWKNRIRQWFGLSMDESDITRMIGQELYWHQNQRVLQTQKLNHTRNAMLIILEERRTQLLASAEDTSKCLEEVLFD